MSKRCELQKEYYKEFGNYKGEGKYSDHYVNWLESRILALTIPVVSDMLCGSFDADNSTSSATKCKCGREKWEHPKPTELNTN